VATKAGSKGTITESELSELNYPDAPKIVTESVPGPKTKQLWDTAMKYESPTRVGGVYLPFVWEEALGATVRDPDGNVFVDLTGGLGTNNTGHTHPRVVQTIIAQAPKLMHTLDMPNPPEIELSQRLAEIMPGDLRNNCFTCYATSGSAAVEIAIKYAKYITKRPEIIAFQGAYHGIYHGSLALTTSYHYRQGFGPFMPGVTHLPYAYCYRCFAGLEYPSCGLQCAKYADEVLNGAYTGVYEPAAVIVETFQGEGGYLVPPKEFYPMIREVCDKSGALMIVDEIQCGFGRSGKMWAIEHYGVTPDILVWGKGVGGDQPLTGVTVNAKYQDKLDPGSQPATFVGNALSCAVGLTNIEIMTDPADNLMGRAAAVGEEMLAKMQAAAKDSPVIGDVRGKGFYLSMEIVKNKETREPASAEKMFGLMIQMLEQGYVSFVCGRYGNVFRLMPPLTTPRDYFAAAVDTLVATVKRNESELQK
jgi:4-aminobutyrate aminotransferase